MRGRLSRVPDDLIITRPRLADAYANWNFHRRSKVAEEFVASICSPNTTIIHLLDHAILDLDLGFARKFIETGTYQTKKLHARCLDSRKLPRPYFSLPQANREHCRLMVEYLRKRAMAMGGRHHQSQSQSREDDDGGAPGPRQ